MIRLIGLLTAITVITNIPNHKFQTVKKQLYAFRNIVWFVHELDPQGPDPCPGQGLTSGP